MHSTKSTAIYVQISFTEWIENDEELQMSNEEDGTQFEGNMYDNGLDQIKCINIVPHLIPNNALFYYQPATPTR